MRTTLPMDHDQIKRIAEHRRRLRRDVRRYTAVGWQSELRRSREELLHFDKKLFIRLQDDTGMLNFFFTEAQKKAMKKCLGKS